MLKFYEVQLMNIFPVILPYTFYLRCVAYLSLQNYVCFVLKQVFDGFTFYIYVYNPLRLILCELKLGLFLFYNFQTDVKFFQCHFLKIHFFHPLNWFGIFVKNWFMIYAWVYFQILYSVPLIYISICRSVLHCFITVLPLFSKSDGIDLPGFLLFNISFTNLGHLHFYTHLKINL